MSTSTLDGAYWRIDCKGQQTDSSRQHPRGSSDVPPPIKNDDPELDFYIMYKRETMEYDTEYMQKYNEDLNTTLIFVCFCVPFITIQH